MTEWRRYRRLHERDLDAEVRDELAFHVQMRTESLIAEGLDAGAARREAERRLGDAGQLFRRCRTEAQRTWRRRRTREVLMRLVSDVVHALRGLRRRPLFFAGACATLAFGIGATTTVYSMVDAVLLAPLPYAEADKLVMIRTIDGQAREVGLALEAKERLSEAGPFDAIAAYGGGSRVLGGAGEPEEIEIMPAEHNLFDVLGVRPALGSSFTDEHRANGGAARVVLLSWSLWQRRFGGDRGVIGQSVELGEQPHVILGVMPAGFEFPVGGSAQLWTPLIHAPIDETLRHTPVRYAVARLAPGVHLGEAHAAVTTVVSHVAETGTDAFGAPIIEGGERWTARLVPAREAMLVSDRALVLLLAAVALLLAIACANVSNLFLVRASERRGEMAVRAALGGSRFDLAAPAIAEVTLLCVLAAFVGLAITLWATGVLATIDPGGMPRWDGIRLNSRAWMAASAATALAAFACAFAPGLAAARTVPGEILRSDTRATDSRHRLRLRDAVVAFEIGLVFVLLVGTSLLLRSFSAVRSVDTGYDLENVLTARVVLPPSRYPRSGTATLEFYEDALSRLRAHPAVVSAGIVSAVPMSDGGAELGGEIESPVTGRKATGGKLLFVSPGYFRSLGVTVRGRDIEQTAVRGGPRVAIFNESMARHMFPGQDALGQRFLAGPGEWEVIGVVPDMHYHGPEEDPAPTYFAAHTQFPFLPGMVFVVRTAGDASAFGRVLVDIVRGIDPALPVADVRTLDQNLSRVLARRRFDLIMLAGIALTGLGLAAVGVFGVMAHAVSQRRHELGIRQALGATGRDISALVLRRALLIVAAGVAGGAVAALFAGRALRTVLFDVPPTDPLSFLLATATVGVIGTIAALVPARRGATSDPAVVLRS
jgi:putative ABC transport system permease protein